MQVVESALTNFLRAEQRTTALMKYQIAKKYLGLGFILVAVLVISRNLTAFYTASVISETLALVVARRLVPSRRPSARARATADFSRPLYRELLGFGIPMMIGYELSGIILSVGDRYVIEGVIGEEQLGLYAAAYNLCQYVQALVITSVSQAIMPIYMQMWDQKGMDETSAFISRSLRTYAHVRRARRRRPRRRRPRAAAVAGVGEVRQRRARPAVGHRRHGRRRHQLDARRRPLHPPQDARHHGHRAELAPSSTSCST